MNIAVVLGSGRVFINGFEYPCLTFECHTVSMRRCAEAAERAKKAMVAFSLGLDKVAPLSWHELNACLATVKVPTQRASLPRPKKKKAQWKLDPRSRQWGAR